MKRKNKTKKLSAILLSGLLAFGVLTAVPCTVGAAEASSSQSVAAGREVYVESLSYLEEGHYADNEGDSFIDAIGTRSEGEATNGVTYKHGLEIWIARWNFKNESSWVWKTYQKPSDAKYLMGTLSYILSSYNNDNFNSTLEIYGDDTLIYQRVVTPDFKSESIALDVSAYSTIKISAYDNEAKSGGTSLCLGNLRFTDVKYTMGDVNADGVIDISDATAIQKAVAQIISFTDEENTAANVNGDGTVDISDATMVQKFVAQIITEFTAA